MGSAHHCFNSEAFDLSQAIPSVDIATLSLKMSFHACKLCARYLLWPRGLTDKASDFESEDCGFESHRGRVLQISL